MDERERITISLFIKLIQKNRRAQWSKRMKEYGINHESVSWEILLSWLWKKGQEKDACLLSLSQISLSSLSSHTGDADSFPHYERSGDHKDISTLLNIWRKDQVFKVLTYLILTCIIPSHTHMRTYSGCVSRALNNKAAR